MIRRLPRRALLLAPSAAVLAGGSALLLLEQRWRQPPPPWRPGGDSPLLGQPVPTFALPGLNGQPGLASTDIAAAGRPVLLNFFASWCLPCQQEAPVLQRLAQGGLPVWGIDYRDKPADAADFLRKHADPYHRLGSDPDGQAGRAFQLIGVPESFLVDRHGIVRWHWAGGLSEDVVHDELTPLLASGRPDRPLRGT